MPEGIHIQKVSRKRMRRLRRRRRRKKIPVHKIVGVKKDKWKELDQKQKIRLVEKAYTRFSKRRRKTRKQKRMMTILRFWYNSLGKKFRAMRRKFYDYIKRIKKAQALEDQTDQWALGQLVRIANSNPEVRDTLLPVISKHASLDSTQEKTMRTAKNKLVLTEEQASSLRSMLLDVDPNRHDRQMIRWFLQQLSNMNRKAKKKIDWKGVQEAAMDAAADIFGDEMDPEKVKGVVDGAKKKDPKDTEDAVQIAIDMMRSKNAFNDSALTAGSRYRGASSTLSEMIRLAYDNPSLRPKLLPLIKSANFSEFMHEMGDREVPNPNPDGRKKKVKIKSLSSDEQKKYFEKWKGSKDKGDKKDKGEVKKPDVKDSKALKKVDSLLSKAKSPMEMKSVGVHIDLHVKNLGKKDKAKLKKYISQRANQSAGKKASFLIRKAYEDPSLQPKLLPLILKLRNFQA